MTVGLIDRASPVFGRATGVCYELALPSLLVSSEYQQVSFFRKGF
jgi:hypothetical protein